MYSPQEPMPAIKPNFVSIAGKIIILLILIIALIYTVSVIYGCGMIPIIGYCDLWYNLTTSSGKPMVLIVYGNEGLGNPDALELALNDPNYAFARTRQIHLNRISPGILKDYQVVIVTKAKKMTAEQINMFIEYVELFRGKLVWTGDAGTDFPLKPGETRLQAEQRELLYEHEETGINTDLNKIINPWARRYQGDSLRLDVLLSASFQGIYCEEFKERCELNELPLVGSMEKLSPSHRTVLGIRDRIKVYGNPAIVTLINSSTTSLIADVGGRKEFGTETRYPLIIESFGGRVLYYALPLEEFVNEKIPFDENGNPQTIPSLIQKMYESSIK